MRSERADDNSLKRGAVSKDDHFSLVSFKVKQFCVDQTLTSCTQLSRGCSGAEMSST